MVENNLITSKSNNYFLKIKKLIKGNKENHTFLIEGEDLVLEAFKHNSLEELIYLKDTKINKEYKSIPYHFFSKELIREISSYNSIPSIFGIGKKKYSKNYGDSVVYLDNLQDPGNVGTIIRTAFSFNYSSLVLSLNSVSLYNNKVVQASKGAIFGLNIGREDLTYFLKNKYNIYLTTLDGINEKELNELVKPFVIVFSNEGKGVSKEYINLGQKIRIEMNNIDSLNVASAAAILLYRFKGGN